MRLKPCSIHAFLVSNFTFHNENFAFKENLRGCEVRMWIILLSWWKMVKMSLKGRECSINLCHPLEAESKKMWIFKGEIKDESPQRSSRPVPVPLLCFFVTKPDPAGNSNRFIGPCFNPKSSCWTLSFSVFYHHCISWWVFGNFVLNVFYIYIDIYISRKWSVAFMEFLMFENEISSQWFTCKCVIKRYWAVVFTAWHLSSIEPAVAEFRGLSQQIWRFAIWKLSPKSTRTVPSFLHSFCSLLKCLKHFAVARNAVYNKLRQGEVLVLHCLLCLIHALITDWTEDVDVPRFFRDSVCIQAVYIFVFWVITKQDEGTQNTDFLQKQEFNVDEIRHISHWCLLMIQNSQHYLQQDKQFISSHL